MALGAHNRLFFEQISERVPGAEYTLYFVQEELAAFNLLVVKQEAMVDKYFCMDHELGRKYNLYVLSWLENVRYCVERKIPLYHAGQGAEKTKAHLGATLIPSFILFKHRQPVINRFLIAWPAVSEKVLSHLGFWPRADRSTSLFAALIRPRRRMNSGGTSVFSALRKPDVTTFNAVAL
jgi:hypothetical protein